MEKRLFTIAMILLLSLSMLAVLKMNVAQAAPYATLQDAEIATKMSDQHWFPIGFQGSRSASLQ